MPLTFPHAQGADVYGEIVMVGEAAGAIGCADVPLDVRSLYLKDLSFFGHTVLEPQVFGNLIGQIERGEIVPLVAQTYPLRDSGAAQAAFDDKGFMGKIVLEVP